LPPETRIGHVHLHVGDLDEAMRFYHGVLGFDNQGVMRRFRMAMVSAGGYHHHIGLNTWQGEGAPPAPPDAVGLRWFSVVLPDEAALEAVLERVRTAGLTPQAPPQGWFLHDPFRNGVVLTTRAAWEANAATNGISPYIPTILRYTPAEQENDRNDGGVEPPTF